MTDKPKPSKLRILLSLLAGGILGVVLFWAAIRFSWLSSSASISVYFSKASGNHFVTEPVLRTLPKRESNPVGYAVQQLLAGPSVQEKKLGYFSEIPSGTQLLGVTADKSGAYTVNLSRDFTTGGGSNSMVQRLQSVQQTAVEAAHHHPVYLQVEGHTLKVLGGEGVEVSEPLAVGKQ